MLSPADGIISPNIALESLSLGHSTRLGGADPLTHTHTHTPCGFYMNEK